MERERWTVTATRRGRCRPEEQEFTCPGKRSLTSVLEEFKHMHMISKHQCSACQTKLLGLTLKNSIFTLFSVTKVIIFPLPFTVPSFQTLRSFSNLFSVVILERKIIWMSKSLTFQPLFLTPWNNVNVSECSTRTEYSGWCFCHLWISCTIFPSLKLVNPQLPSSQCF